MLKKRSFLERLTGSIRLDEKEEENNDDLDLDHASKKIKVVDEDDQEIENGKDWQEEAELTIDVYQTPSDIVIQSMIAGVHPDNLTITITRDSVTIRGKREENKSVNEDNYFIQELYWGTFSRTISLPEEVNPEEAEAIEKHGLLIIKLPKIDKNRETKLKVKSI